MGSFLVGVSHECDYPHEALRLPKVTRSNIPTELPSREIDSTVSTTLETQGTLYELDLPLLESLRPDLILTQQLCSVCAVSFDRVQEAVKNLPSRPTVLNLEPRSLEDIFENIHLVAKALGVESAGKALVNSLKQRLKAIRARTEGIRYRRICTALPIASSGSACWNSIRKSLCSHAVALNLTARSKKHPSSGDLRACRNWPLSSQAGSTPRMVLTFSLARDRGL
jgi:hypothetical protein